MKSITGPLLFIILTGNLSFGQSLGACDTLEVTQQSKALLKKLLPKLDNVMGNSDLPPVGFQKLTQKLIQTCFHDEKVFVYNDFNPKLPGELPILNYLTLNHIEVAGNSIDWDQARFNLGTTTAGPVVNIYASKIVRLATGKEFKNLLEFRVRYVQSRSDFSDFKIVGIRKVSAFPAKARILSNETLSTLVCRQQELSLSSVIKQLADEIRKKLPSPVKKVVLEKFTYNNSGIPNAFSDEVYGLLRTELFSQGIETTLPARTVDAFPIRVKGSYQRDVNELKFKAEVIDNHTGGVIAATENSDLPILWLSEHQMQLEPDGMANALAVRDTIQQGTLPVIAGSGLTMQVKTNKGRDGVEFLEGQEMTLSVKANKPCFLRIVYLLPDGTKTLLVDNFSVSKGQENKEIPVKTKIPLICSAPFGQEYLLAFSSTNRFATLPNIRVEGGYEIIESSLETILQTIRGRGFPTQKIPKNESPEKPGIVEDRIKIISRAI